MLTDQLSTFTGKNGQSITSSTNSTDWYDWGEVGTPVPGHATALTRDMGVGNKVTILVQVTETFATLTSLTVSVQADNDSGFGSPTTILSTPAVAAASLTAGYIFPIEVIPPRTTERYIRLYFTVAGSAATAGKIFAAVTLGNQHAVVGP